MTYRRRIGQSALTFVLFACSSGAADVVFDVEVPPTDQALITRVEAVLSEVANVELIGSVEGRGDVVMIVRYSEAGEECVGVFHETGSDTLCGDIEPQHNNLLIMSGGSTRDSFALFATPPHATEVRATTSDGETYSAPTVGPYGYISFERTDGPRILSVWSDDELIFEG